MATFSYTHKKNYSAMNLSQPIKEIGCETRKQRVRTVWVILNENKLKTQTLNP